MGTGNWQALQVVYSGIPGAQLLRRGQAFWENGRYRRWEGAERKPLPGVGVGVGQEQKLSVRKEPSGLWVASSLLGT